jgi:hypothetical protein
MIIVACPCPQPANSLSHMHPGITGITGTRRSPAKIAEAPPDLHGGPDNGEPAGAIPGRTG